MLGRVRTPPHATDGHLRFAIRPGGDGATIDPRPILENWAQLKRRVDVGSRVARFKPHPRFDDAVAALDYGDLERLRGLIASDPALVYARTNLEPPYGYFTGATLLHHVAGNPSRGRLEGLLPPLPRNTVEMARLLLDSGADVNALTLGPSGGTTMGNTFSR